MASRNPYSSIHPRIPPSSSSLFDSYPGAGAADNRSRPASSHSPARASYAYGGGGSGSPSPYTDASAPPSFRPATPNSKGQYSHSVLESLESQNENENTSALSAKVGQLKQLTMAIGDEIRESSALAERMNDGFEDTRLRLKGTMRRMLRMAERTGVGWRVWLGFFAVVWGLFVWVWLF